MKDSTRDANRVLFRKLIKSILMDKKSQQVVPNLQGGWSVKSRGALRATKSFNTQVDAISWARSKSKKRGLVLIIHGRDGMVRSRVSYERNLYPPGQRNGRK